MKDFVYGGIAAVPGILYLFNKPDTWPEWPYWPMLVFFGFMAIGIRNQERLEEQQREYYLAMAKHELEVKLRLEAEKDLAKA